MPTTKKAERPTKTAQCRQCPKPAWMNEADCKAFPVWKAKHQNLLDIAWKHRKIKTRSHWEANIWIITGGK